MHAPVKQLRLELSEPFDIRVLIVESEQKQANSTEETTAKPPQTNKEN
jgi:hypothetical protein